MSPSTDNYQSTAKSWRIALALVLIVGFLIGFRHEVGLSWFLLRTVGRIILGWPVDRALVGDEFRALIVVGSGIVAILAGYLVSLYWVSRFVLPTLTPNDMWEVYKRLFVYNLPASSGRGPVAFFKEGKPVAGKDELNEVGEGIALLDIYSAIVQEKQYTSDEERTTPGSRSRPLDGGVKPVRKPAKAIREWVNKVNGLGNDQGFVPVRAHGPGLALTRYDEKITRWADLRKQFRFRGNVKANTGDGIEVTTSVFAVFTLGQPPDVLRVAKVGGEWKIVKIEAYTPARNVFSASRLPDSTIKFTGDELPEEGRAEIEAFVQRRQFSWSHEAPDKPKPDVPGRLPFVFDEDRVISATYSRAREVREGKAGEWTDLAVDVAVGIFRDFLVHTNFDDLYIAHDPAEFPLNKIRQKFAGAVRNTGVLAYQVVQRMDGRPLENGARFRRSELALSPVREFTRSEVLRDRGIKVIAAGFGDLTPTSDTVQKQFFDNWRAHWQQVAAKTLADHDLQAARIRNHERAKAQQDMIHSLSQILQSEQYTNEALVMRLYQALESAATQPATQRLLPRDTIRMLWNLREWLSPQEDKGAAEMPKDFVDSDEEDDEELEE